jgi:hypothetical protein
MHGGCCDRVREGGCLRGREAPAHGSMETAWGARSAQGTVVEGARGTARVWPRCCENSTA